MATLTERMIRASKLDVNLYEEVEADKEAMGQAVTIVVLSGVAAGIGSLGALGIKGLFIGTISALVGWFVWAYITFFVGTKILPEEPCTKHPCLLRRSTSSTSMSRPSRNTRTNELKVHVEGTRLLVSP